MRVAVLGSGNFGSVIARNVARNLQNINEFPVKEVKMWVHDELVNGKSLVDIINDERVNVKYLPGVKLPDNVIATHVVMLIYCCLLFLTSIYLVTYITFWIVAFCSLIYSALMYYTVLDVFQGCYQSSKAT